MTCVRIAILKIAIINSNGKIKQGGENAVHCILLFRSKLSASFAQTIQVFTLKIEPIFLLPSITKKLPDVGSLS